MGNKPKAEDLPKIHEKVLEMLKIVHDVCEKEKISYFMQAGTLLGAVRNKGFIPWDDDGDIMMYREEFDKLISVIDGYLKDTEYFLKYTDRVPKVVCRNNEDIRLDIFIIDYLPNNKLKRKYKLFILKLIQGMSKEDVDLSAYSLKGKILVGVTSTLGKLFSEKKKLEMYDRMSRYGNDVSASECFWSNDLYRFINYKFERNYFRETFLMDFEDTRLYAPKNYDSYLIINYGKDYMTPMQDNYYVSYDSEQLKKVVSGKES